MVLSDMAVRRAKATGKVYDPFPLSPLPLPLPSPLALAKHLGIGQRPLPGHNQCGLGPGRIDAGRLAVPPPRWSRFINRTEHHAHPD